VRVFKRNTILTRTPTGCQIENSNYLSFHYETPCTMYILTPKLVLGVQYEQNRLLSYIYKCTELRFYHKANMILKQQNHTRLP